LQLQLQAPSQRPDTVEVQHTTRRRAGGTDWALAFRGSSSSRSISTGMEAVEWKAGWSRNRCRFRVGRAVAAHPCTCGTQLCSVRQIRAAAGEMPLVSTLPKWTRAGPFPCKKAVAAFAAAGSGKRRLWLVAQDDPIALAVAAAAGSGASQSQVDTVAKAGQEKGSIYRTGLWMLRILP